VQEALTNTLKRADASRVNVLVRYGAGALELEVVDDGRGAAAGNHRGRGFIGMNGRAALFGGDPPTASGFLSTPSISASSSTPSDRTKALAWNGPVESTSTVPTPPSPT